MEVTQKRMVSEYDNERSVGKDLQGGSRDLFRCITRIFFQRF
jgi:hypothetical protein